MRVFLSHSHRDKALPCPGDPLVPARIYIGVDRRVRAPDSVDINVPIRNAIQDEADFVIIFLSHEAMKSEWVRRECEWALERDKQIGKVFVLPVLPYRNLTHNPIHLSF